MFSASEVLDLAMQVEENGERYYRKVYSRVYHEPLKELLGWLADEEVKHKALFQEIKDRVCAAGSGCDSISDVSGSALRSAMGRHAFALDELESSSVQDEKDLLRTAIEFENDSIQFFEFIATLITDPQALFSIQEIRRQELQHKQLLMAKLSDM